MRHYLYIAAASLGLLASCADNDMVQMTPDEPSSLAAYDYLKDYDVLKSYADFPVGTNIDGLDFLDSGEDYRITASNFSEALPGVLFSHSWNVKASGKVDSTDVVSAATRATGQGMTLFAYPLVSNSNTNAIYLTSLLEPDVTHPEGEDGGYALKMTNSTTGSSMTSEQVAYTFPRTPSVEPGITYRLSFMVRGTSEGTVQCATYSNGKGSVFKPSFKVTSKWKKVTMTNSIASGITGLKSLLFNIGKYIGTLYVDDIELYEVDDWDEVVSDNLNSMNANLDSLEATQAAVAIQTTNGGIEEAGASALGEGYDPLATYTEKTAEAKASILKNAMDKYLAGMATAAGNSVTDWAVVCNPLDATDVATSEGHTMQSGEFFWADYLGKDYAVEAFKSMASHVGDNAKLYICETGMESDAAKRDALIEYVNYIENAGARVDGIGTTVNIDSLTADTEPIKELFAKLAATGKMVKITNLQVAVGNGLPTDSLSEEQAQKQAELYRSVVAAYMQQVPAAQRGGIVQCSVLDDDDEPLGLWSRSFSRKHAYAGFADGLKDNN